MAQTSAPDFDGAGLSGGGEVDCAACGSDNAMSANAELERIIHPNPPTTPPRRAPKSAGVSWSLSSSASMTERIGMVFDAEGEAIDR